MTDPVPPPLEGPDRERLDRLTARIAGLVLNRDGRHEEYYGY